MKNVSADQNYLPIMARKLLALTWLWKFKCIQYMRAKI